MLRSKIRTFISFSDFFSEQDVTIELIDRLFRSSDLRKLEVNLTDAELHTLDFCVSGEFGGYRGAGGIGGRGVKFVSQMMMLVGLVWSYVTWGYLVGPGWMWKGFHISDRQAGQQGLIWWGKLPSPICVNDGSDSIAIR